MRSRSLQHRKSVSAAELLRDLYISIWEFCAGWNRVPFRAAQLRFILKANGISLNLLPLEGVSSISVIANSTKSIGLNYELVPESIRSKGINATTNWIGDSSEALYARFVVFHEIGHLLLHADSNDVDNDLVGTNQETKWLRSIRERYTSEQSMYLLPGTIREIEADFFALIAILPDYVLLESEIDGIEDQQQLVEFVRRTLVGSIPHNDLPGAHLIPDTLFEEFSEYRVQIFKVLARPLYYVSNKVSIKGIVETRTLRHAMKDWEFECEPDLNTILSLHPLAIKDKKLAKLMESHLPFRDFVAPLAKKYWPWHLGFSDTIRRFV